MIILRGVVDIMGQFDRLAEKLSELLWGPWTVLLVLVSGVWFSVTNGWLQLRADKRYPE